MTQPAPHTPRERARLVAESWARQLHLVRRTPPELLAVVASYQVVVELRPHWTLNVGGDPGDVHWAYRMPPIHAKPRGAGNATKTMLPNLQDVAAALRQPPTGLRPT